MGQWANESKVAGCVASRPTAPSAGEPTPKLRFTARPILRKLWRSQLRMWPSPPKGTFRIQGLPFPRRQQALSIEAIAADVSRSAGITLQFAFFRSTSGGQTATPPARPHPPEWFLSLNRTFFAFTPLAGALILPILRSILRCGQCRSRFGPYRQRPSCVWFVLMLRHRRNARRASQASVQGSINGKPEESLASASAWKRYSSWWTPVDSRILAARARVRWRLALASGGAVVPPARIVGSGSGLGPAAARRNSKVAFNHRSRSALHKARSNGRSRNGDDLESLLWEDDFSGPIGKSCVAVQDLCLCPGARLSSARTSAASRLEGRCLKHLTAFPGAHQHLHDLSPHQRLRHSG